MERKKSLLQPGMPLHGTKGSVPPQMSTLSDRLKTVEEEINEITSLMSLQDSVSKVSVIDTVSVSSASASGKSSCKSLLTTSSTSSSSLKRTPRRISPSAILVGSGGGEGGVARTLKLGSSCTFSRSDTRLKNGYSLSRSSSENLSESPSLAISLASNNRDGEIGDLPKKQIKSIVLPSTRIGDNVKINLPLSKGVPSYDSLQTFLHNINNTIIKGNEAVMSKITDSCLEMAEFEMKTVSAPCSNYGRGKMNNAAEKVNKYQELIKEVGVERDKRMQKEIMFDDLQAEADKLKDEIRKQKEMCSKFRELSEQLEKENKEQAEMLKTAERSFDEREMELELYKQKYESVVRDLKMEQEHGWVLERDLQQLKDCLDQSQLKIQELLGARTMAVELAHDLQKKHQSYVVEHQFEWQELKNKNAELEKLLRESVHEKNCVVERLQAMENVSQKCKKLENEVNEYKKSIADAEKTICELTRNPEGIPQVRSMLNSQEQTFKAALTEKATSEMALQAKYTTLEVELQIIQDEYNKRLDDLQEEKQKLLDEYEPKIKQQSAEIEKLQLVAKELTELSNQYKSKITELSDINKHQEVLIKCQNEAISSKEERVKLSNQEAELNIRRVEQEKKALMMDHEKTINSLKKLLEEERDKVLVKDKIADDQTETIMQLRQNLADKVKEVQRKSKEVHRLEQSLKQEKNDKENLSCDVQHLKMHRARMNETIAELQKQIEVYKGNNVHKKHTQMLEDLEKRVAQKQVEWESEVSKLKTERDQARETAQYAIENLSSAMEEYQKELANQKTLQTKLAGLIREKEEQLNAAENRHKIMFHTMLLAHFCSGG